MSSQDVYCFMHNVKSLNNVTVVYTYNVFFVRNLTINCAIDMYLWRPVGGRNCHGYRKLDIPEEIRKMCC